MKNSILYAAFLGILLNIGCDRKEDLPQGEYFAPTVALYNGSGKLAKQADSHYKTSLVASQEDLGSEKQVEFSVSLFREVSQDITVNLGLSDEKVALFNQTYGTSYAVFPKDLITSFTSELSIEKGKANSETGMLTFTVSDTLKDNTPYLIAIEIQSVSGGVQLLKNAHTLYYSFEKTKGQIKKVVALTRDTYLGFSQGAYDLGSTFTMEGLVYVDKFRGPGDSGDAGITTFMGTEGQALMRFGDAGVDPNHLQASGTDIGYTFKEKTWYHIALVVANGKTIAYVNGNKVAELSVAKGLGEFYIGRSYNSNRGLPGMVSEVRLWSVARTEAEIRENMTYVSPKTAGLYAYWKMNDNEGSVIKDVSGNGRDLVHRNQNSMQEVPVSIKDIDGVEL